MLGPRRGARRWTPSRAAPPARTGQRIREILGRRGRRRLRSSRRGWGGGGDSGSGRPGGWAGAASGGSGKGPAGCWSRAGPGRSLEVRGLWVPLSWNLGELLGPDTPTPCL